MSGKSGSTSVAWESDHVAGGDESSSAGGSCVDAELESFNF